MIKRLILSVTCILFSCHAYACPDEVNALIKFLPKDEQVLNAFVRITKEVKTLSLEELEKIAEDWEFKIFNEGDPTNNGKKRPYHSGLQEAYAHIRVKDLNSYYAVMNVGQSLWAYIFVYLEGMGGTLETAISSYYMYSVLHRIGQAREDE